MFAPIEDFATKNRTLTLPLSPHASGLKNLFNSSVIFRENSLTNDLLPIAIWLLATALEPSLASSTAV